MKVFKRPELLQGCAGEEKYAMQAGQVKGYSHKNMREGGREEGKQGGREGHAVKAARKFQGGESMRPETSSTTHMRTIYKAFFYK